MTKLPDGLYDLLITRAVERELEQIDPARRFADEELDPSEAHVPLARHIAAIVREALRGVPAEERAARQTAISNEILRTLTSALPTEVGENDLVAEPPRKLAAIYQFDPLRDARPPAPAIPLAQSDLLVNA